MEKNATVATKDTNSQKWVFVWTTFLIAQFTTWRITPARPVTPSPTLWKTTRNSKKKAKMCFGTRVCSWLPEITSVLKIKRNVTQSFPDVKTKSTQSVQRVNSDSVCQLIRKVAVKTANLGLLSGNWRKMGKPLEGVTATVPRKWKVSALNAKKHIWWCSSLATKINWNLTVFNLRSSLSAKNITPMESARSAWETLKFLDSLRTPLTNAKNTTITLFNMLMNIKTRFISTLSAKTDLSVTYKFPFVWNKMENSTVLNVVKDMK